MRSFFRMLPICLFVLCLSVSTFAAGGSSEPAKPDSKRLISKAEGKIYNEKYEEALPLLEEAREVDPDNADIYNLLGFSQRKLGQTDVAMESYKKALQLNPEHRRAMEYMGELYLTLKQPEKATTLLKKLQRLCGNCSEYRMLEKAIADYN